MQIKLTKDQQKAYEVICTGENVYLYGQGGTGKSFLLNYVIEQFRANKKTVIVCAPTGIAALNVGGCTIHRVLGIRPERTLELKPYYSVANDSPLYDCDVLIVDEISMCRIDLFDYLSNVLKKVNKYRLNHDKKACQLIVVGDFCQLPPVITDDRRQLQMKYDFDIDHGYAFISPEWDCWDFKFVALSESLRQKDSDFAAALDSVRLGNIKSLRWIEKNSSPKSILHAIVLFGRNADANNENSKRLRKLRTEPFVYKSKITGKIDQSDKPTLDKLTLKKGARIMALVNDTEDTFMNGSMGFVEECYGDKIRVKFDNNYEVELEPYKWNIMKPSSSGGRVRLQTVGSFTQIPVKLAYAITIHKSQGQTFDSIILKPDCWEPGQLYTALSRVTSLEGLYFVNRCSENSLIASDNVIAFYSSINNAENFKKTIASPIVDIQNYCKSHKLTEDEIVALLNLLATNISNKH